MSFRPRLLAVVCLVALLGGGCASALNPAAAVVGGSKISEASVESEVDFVRADTQFQALVRQQGPQFRGDYRRRVLFSLIQLEVMRNELAKRKESLTPKDIDAAYAAFEQRAGGRQAFLQSLKENRVSPERARKLAERQAVSDKLQRLLTAELKVDEATVESFYKQNESYLKQVRVQRITVTDQAQASQIVDQLKAGADFTELAKQTSIEPNGPTGGDAGWVDLRSLGAAATDIESAPDGGIAGPVQGPGGFQIYKINERRTAPLQAVRKEIEDQLLAQDRQEAVAKFLGEAMTKTQIVVNPKYGHFDPATSEIVAGSSRVPS